MPRAPSLRLGLFAALFGALFVLAIFAVNLQDAYNARTRPLTGVWALELTLDSATPRHWHPEWRPRAGARIAGAMHLRPGAPAWLGATGRFWQAAFLGSHALDFGPLLGYPAPRPLEAVGVRVGSDSLRLYLSGYCCHSGAILARGRLTADSVATGTWTVDSDGWGAWGRFTLRRRPSVGIPTGSLTSR